MKDTVNQTVYRLASAVLAMMLVVYLVVLMKAGKAALAGDENALLFWTCSLLLPLTVAWVTAVLASPFVRQLEGV